MADPTPPSDAAASVVEPTAAPEVLPPSAPAVATAGTATLAVISPYHATFVSHVEGWAPIGKLGTKGPTESADQVIELAAKYGVNVERR